MPLHLVMNTVNKRFITKRLNQSMLYAYTKLNLSTKSKNYYEVLEISPDATYNEIKSAYYKLTLKYHPDKNKSESAKHKFHEISDAYDVLSKYESRRRYNKTLPKSHQTVSFRNEQKSQKSEEYSYHPEKLYNYDDWLKQHYSETFKEGTRAKEIRLKAFDASRRHETYRANVRGINLAIVIGITLATLIRHVLDR